MRYEELPPPALWRESVECFWNAVDPVPRLDRPPEHIVPDGCPELIVHLGEPFSRRLDGRWRRAPTARYLTFSRSCCASGDGARGAAAFDFASSLLARRARSTYERQERTWRSLATLAW